MISISSRFQKSTQIIPAIVRIRDPHVPLLYRKIEFFQKFIKKEALKLKKKEFIASMRGEHNWIKLTHEEVYQLSKALGELDSFVAEKKTVLKPLSEIEINGLFLYLTQYSDKPIIELEYEEKREIVRDHIDELQSIDAVTDKEIERVNLSDQITSTEPVFKVSLLKDALLAHFI